MKQSKWSIKDQDIYITPNSVYDDFVKYYAIDLRKAYDPCPYPESSIDGLIADWQPITYCNPPFSRCREWFIKAKQESSKGNVIYMVLPFYFIINNGHRHYKGCEFDKSVTISKGKTYSFTSPLGLSYAKITCHLAKISRNNL